MGSASSPASRMNALITAIWPLQVRAGGLASTAGRCGATGTSAVHAWPPLAKRPSHSILRGAPDSRFTHASRIATERPRNPAEVPFRSIRPQTPGHQGSSAGRQLGRQAEGADEAAVVEGDDPAQLTAAGHSEDLDRVGLELAVRGAEVGREGGLPVGRYRYHREPVRRGQYPGQHEARDLLTP